MCTPDLSADSVSHFFLFNPFLPRLPDIVVTQLVDPRNKHPMLTSTAPSD